MVGKSLDDLQAQDAHKQSSASSTTNAETSWFSSIWGTTSAVTTEASSTQEKTPEQSNVSWYAWVNCSDGFGSLFVVSHELGSAIGSANRLLLLKSLTAMKERLLLEKLKPNELREK